MSDEKKTMIYLAQHFSRKLKSSKVVIKLQLKELLSG